MRTLADVIVTDPKQEIEKHKESEDSPDTSPSSPPLETDESGTPGPMGVEVNIPFTYDSDRGGNSRSVGVDANLGIGERGQLRVEQNYFEERDSGSKTLKGSDETSVGFKYRFFDNKKFKFALYPGLQIDDETRAVDKDGLKLGSEGNSFYLPLIAAQQVGKVTFAEDAGYAWNLTYGHRYSVFTSAAVGFSITDTTRLMGELASTQTEEGRRTNLRIGLVQEIFPREDSKFETALFFSYGHSIASTDDHLNHSIALAGFTIARKADGQK